MLDKKLWKKYSDTVDEINKLRIDEHEKKVNEVGEINRKIIQSYPLRARINPFLFKMPELELLEKSLAGFMEWQIGKVKLD